jgi:hypothetical protein
MRSSKPHTANKPNFFILGAGKSGTTSLYYYLQQHPDIFLSSIKETCFFNENFQIVKNPIKYFELYDDVCNEKIIGEASHVYFSNPSTAKVLHALFPNAKFIVILRNPADRAYSLYHHMRRYGFEKINNFGKALLAEEIRFKSKKFKENCPHYFYNYMYFRSGLYGEQIDRYFKLYPRDQFYIIKFEDFINDSLSFLKKIFAFLGVDQHFSPTIEIHNEGKKTARYSLIQYYLQKITKRITILSEINMMDIPALDTQTRDLLFCRYSDDLQTLYELTGISFTDTDRL